MMEKTKITKLAALLVALVLMVGAMVGVGISAVSADEITETASIVRKNVEHKDYLHLAFAVQVTTAPEDAEIGIMVWADDVTDFNSANKLWASYELKFDGAETYYYASQPIAAKDIATNYKVAVVAKTADGITLLSKPAAYSVAAWAAEKLTENPDPARENLYKKVLAYGEAASTLLNK
jgi:hypothetical protein